MTTIRTEVDQRGVTTLTLARPEKRNALSAEMIRDLTTAADALGGDPSVRLVVLAAEGDVFCAGGDLGWMQAQMAADAETRRAEAMALALMFKALNDMPKPLVGRISGNAFGGGLGLIAVTDIAFAAEGTRFGLTETRLGLIPATIGPYVVARVGAATARSIMATPRLFSAEAAKDHGFLNHIVPLADLDAAIEAEIAPYLTAAPRAVGRAKALVRSLGPKIDRDVIAASVDQLVATWEDPEALEGTSAFFEKRSPDWAV